MKTLLSIAIALLFVGCNSKVERYNTRLGIKNDIKYRLLMIHMDYGAKYFKYYVSRNTDSSFYWKGKFDATSEIFDLIDSDTALTEEINRELEYLQQ